MKKILTTVAFTVLVYNVIIYFAAKRDEKAREQKTEKKYKNKIISLPEEIDQATKGDILKVYRTSNDTIYIGYGN